MAFMGKTGKIKHLRVNDLGHLWGTPDDGLRTEVVMVLDSAQDMAFGLELRSEDPNLPSRLSMLALLRDAFFKEREVSIAFDIVEGKKTAHLRRVDIE